MEWLLKSSKKYQDEIRLDLILDGLSVLFALPHSPISATHRRISLSSQDSPESDGDVMESRVSRLGRPAPSRGVNKTLGKSGKSYGRLAEMAREELAWKYEIPKDGKPRIYKMRKEKIILNQDLKIAKYEVGARVNNDVKERVLMLVGATGAGLIPFQFYLSF